VFDQKMNEVTGGFALTVRLLPRPITANSTTMAAVSTTMWHQPPCRPVLHRRLNSYKARGATDLRVTLRLQPAQFQARGVARAIIEPPYLWIQRSLDDDPHIHLDRRATPDAVVASIGVPLAPMRLRIHALSYWQADQSRRVARQPSNRCNFGSRAPFATIPWSIWTAFSRRTHWWLLFSCNFLRSGSICEKHKKWPKTSVQSTTTGARWSWIMSRMVPFDPPYQY